MKIENTSIRLKKLMNERNLRQVDILNLVQPYCREFGVKMNKSDISQYVSGKVEPNQDKLAVLSMALHINEAWLMGFDVPIERTYNAYTSKINELIELAESLSDEDLEFIKEMIKKMKNK